MAETRTLEVRLEDADYYWQDPAETLDVLRESDPVHYYEPLDCFVITKYDDQSMITRTPAIFSSAKGVLLNDFRYGDVVASFFPPNAEVFTLVDPPRHNDLRRLMAPAFTPHRVGKWEDTIREKVVEWLDEIEPGTPYNWTSGIAEPLTCVAISLLLGIPLDDIHLVKEWSDVVIQMGDCTTVEELGALAGSLAPMGAYFEERLAERDKEPRPDLISTLLLAEKDGKISRETLHMMLSGIMTAGNETTRNAISGTAGALMNHPSEMAKLSGGEISVPIAVEEILRWTSPVHGFGRTVTQDTEIRGVHIREGQRVYMLHEAANRDPEAFENPTTFDLTRNFTKPHASFSFGQHSCVGSALTRLEMRVLFEEFGKRFSSVEVISQERVNSTLANGYVDVMITTDTHAA
jgi:cytochrome P450